MENWKPVVGFEGLYEVSDFGRVRSLARPCTPGKVLKQTVTTNRYPMVSLSKENVRSVRTVHSIVCEAFHGPRPDGQWVAHDNGNRTDCRAKNLAWKTVPDNHADKKRHGTQVCGEGHPASRLTAGLVLKARALRDQGHTQQHIAGIVGVTRRTVGRALAGQSWAHL